ncbi:MAG: PAS domain-containing protein [Bacteroidetes bacterium]|nr:PAS domain-containing protein [Bacteroidota bacterium]
MELEKYYKTIQSLTDPIYLCDQSGYISMYNKAAAELWGRAPEPGKEKFCASVRVRNADGTEMQMEKYPVVQSLRYNTQVQSGEVIMERPDGSFRCVVQFTTPIYNVWGQLAGVVNRMVDVTRNMDNQAIA